MGALARRGCHDLHAWTAGCRAVGVAAVARYHAHGSRGRRDAAVRWPRPLHGRLVFAGARLAVGVSRRHPAWIPVAIAAAHLVRHTYLAGCGGGMAGGVSARLSVF